MSTLNSPPPAHTPDIDIDTLAHKAADFAAALLTEANAIESSAEAKQAAKIARMMDDPQGKAFTLALSDQLFRSHRPKRIATRLQHLIEDYGVPRYVESWERGALALSGYMGKLLPHVVIPQVVRKLRQETARVILAGEEKPLRHYLAKREALGTRINLNYLGEAILGEEEAQRRFKAYVTLLQRPDVHYISVKLSSMFSQINLVAFDDTVTRVKARLRELYAVAQTHTFTGDDGKEQAKFINLDMEEYRDLALTVRVFTELLDEPAFKTLRAGIVLQAYLPDAFQVQKELTAWARSRVAAGGAPIKIRIVKGANLAMEQVEASLHDWPQAPYHSKAEVDANYKRMLLYGCQPENAQAVNLGVASHNLFDLAFALKLREACGAEAFVEFEMLEGMANHQAATIQKQAQGLLLYAPIVKQEEFHSAIAYLVRRLDENTQPENFLHDLFGLKPHTPVWEAQKTRFMQAVASRDQVRSEPQRQQNRQQETRHFNPAEPFHNEPDTDFSLPINQQWVKQLMHTWQDQAPSDVPLQIAGELIHSPDKADGFDPSRPEAVPYRYALANSEEIEQALRCATEAQATWAATSVAERQTLLSRCAEELAKARADLIGVSILDAGKAVQQADVEVSEAIDFAIYYARAFDLLAASCPGDTQDCHFTPAGTVLVTPPWNFPVAIPCGSMLASLMAGNTVILKPAPETVLTAWHLVNAFWQAGIPKTVLQFVPTYDDDVHGKTLVTDPRVNKVILTGAYETARMFKSWKPELDLSAETSGKNSLIITALADQDAAIKDLVQSAFGHNGQKCSAASLAVIEAEVYDNPIFLRQLRDAAQSLSVGSAWEPQHTITPLTQLPSPHLHRALTQLDEGETWLLEPQQIGDNPRLWSPGIKLGVKRGSFYHQTECFGPVLGLIRVDSLQEAVETVNDSSLGLTSGIHSLDDREVAYWREHIAVGNAYINRGITGAIVQRQPFGGWKQSAFGSGAKAGGPNYVLSLGHWTQTKDKPDLPSASISPAVTALLESLKENLDAETHDALRAAAERYAYAQAQHYGITHDPSALLGQSNFFRYKLLSAMLIRVQPDDALLDIYRVICAALTANTPVTVSLSPDHDAVDNLHQNLSAAQLTCNIQSDDELVDLLSHTAFDRLRTLQSLPQAVQHHANTQHVPVISEPALSSGRLELRYYLYEQAISETTHRYGNIVVRPSAKG